MASTVFSTQLQQLRKEKGIKQEILAQYLGVSPQAVSKWENGSYPEGDLLPKIADYFGVSIDYLYGRERREVSIEQRVLEHLQAMPIMGEEAVKDYFEQMMKFLWTMQIAAWRSQNVYYNRNVVDEKKSGHYTASQVDLLDGFSYMSLNKSLEYYMLVKEPERGFAKYFSDTDKLAELFGFLGDKDNLKVLLFMLSLDWGENVRIRTIAKQVGISEEKVKLAMEYMLKFNQIFEKAAIIDDNNNREDVYAANVLKADMFLMLLVAADGVLKTPNSYSMQSRYCNRTWVNREELEFLTGNKKNPASPKQGE